MTKLTRREANLLGLGALAAMAMPAFGQTGPIKIGFGMALSGGLAGGGKAALLAYEIWAEEINASGGLMGRQIELVYYDDQSNGATVPGIYSKLLDVDKVDIVLSGYGTNVIVAALPTIMGRKKNFLSFFATNANEHFKYDRYFTVQPSGPDPQAEFSRGFFEIAKGLDPKPKSIAIVGADLEFGVTATSGAREHAREMGLEVVYDRSYPPTTVDFNTIVRSIKAGQPDLIYMASYPPDTAGLIRAIYEVGVTAKMVGGGLVGLQFAALKTQFGPLLNNLVCYDYYAPEPTMKFEGIDAFLAKYRARAAAAGVDPLGLYVPHYAYAQMQILAASIKATNSLDDEQLAQHMHATIFKTIVGDIKFNEIGEWATPRILAIQYQNIEGRGVEQFMEPGKQVILYPEQYKSGNLRSPFTSES